MELTERTKKREELKAILKQIEEEDKAEREQKLRSVKRVWRFTISPVNDSWDRIWDSTIKVYTLKGEVTNKEDMAKAGHDAMCLGEGGIRYLYNTVTQMIVMQTGGGMIYVPHQPAEETARVFEELGMFLGKNPKGGDVTSIVESHSHFNWK